MNKRKRILIVCKYFYPDLTPRSFRATELAKEFARRGHEVKVLFPNLNRDYREFENNYNIKIKSLGNLQLKGISLSGTSWILFFKRVLRRILLILFEYPDIQLMYLVARALINEKGYDLLISIAVPHPIHWGVARVWNTDYTIAKKWIADCGDPFMLTRLDTFRKLFYFKYFEKDFCKKCNLISVPFDSMRNQFYEQYRSKIVVIPQGFDFRNIKKYQGGINHNKPTFIFAGTLIPGKRDLSSFFDFLNKVNEDFLFIVYTNQHDYFEKYRECMGTRLDVRDFVDRETLIFEMSKVDFLINVDSIYDNGFNIEAIPSKLIDYTLAGRPILNLVSNQIDVRGISAFLKGDYSTARHIEIDRYDIRIVVDQFIQSGCKA